MHRILLLFFAAALAGCAPTKCVCSCPHQVMMAGGHVAPLAPRIDALLRNADALASAVERGPDTAAWCNEERNGMHIAVPCAPPIVHRDAKPAKARRR